VTGDDDPRGAGALWNYLGLPGQMRVATYLTADLATVYRLIVDVMLENQPQYLSGIQHDQLITLVCEQLTTQLRDDSDTLASLLDPASLNLDSRLSQLADWGVIHAWEDKVRSDEDFTRHRGRYQLSEEAARLHRVVRDLGTQRAASIAATLAPPVIAATLAQMRDSLDSDPAAVAAAWSTLTPTMANMSDAAAGWQAKLAAALSGTPDPDKIADLNDTLNSYIAMWGAGIDTNSADIAAAARYLLTAPDAALRRVALYIAGADADDDALAAIQTEVLDVLGRVLSWFDGPTSQATVLRRQMRDTIVPLVRNKRALAAVGGHVSRRNELLNLAERLDQALDEDTAWEVWATYTGLFAARHLSLRAPSPGTGADSLSFWDAPPAAVETKLRRQGPRATRGRATRIADRTAGKESARIAAAAAAAEDARTRSEILARSGKPLSAWTNSDQPASEPVADLLTDFIMSIDAAIAGAHREGEQPLRVTSTTGDGLWELTAEPPGPDTPDAVVVLPAGRLVYPDVTLTVSTATDDPATSAGLEDMEELDTLDDLEGPARSDR
jgi:uncharacterized protein (TIGR02677 family)